MGNKWSAIPAFSSEDEDEPPDDEGSLGTLTVTLVDSKNFCPSVESKSDGGGSSIHVLLRVSSSFSSHVYTKPVKYQQKNGTCEWHLPHRKFNFGIPTTESGEVKISLILNVLPPLPALPLSSSQGIPRTRSTHKASVVLGQISIPVSFDALKTQKHTETWVNVETDGTVAGEAPQVRVAVDYASRMTRVLKAGETIIDKYDIEDTIGTGQSVVKKAKNKRTNKEYAVKFLSKQNKGGQILKRSIDKEIEILRSLSHPNIVQLCESIESQDTVHLVMELVKGSDLYDIIQTFGTLRPNLAGAIVGQILSAVAYLHSRGIAHHDIKPENVIVDYFSNKVKLTDFGSASKVTSMPGVAGTLNYMAPEILLNMRGSNLPSDMSVDIWSIGVVAYMLLSGVNPFDYNSKANHNIMNKIISGKFEFPAPQWDAIPKHCKDFIQKCLVVDPKRRATAMELLKHPWITSSPLSTTNCFSKKDQEKLEREKNSRNNSRSNSMQSLLELFNSSRS